MPVLFKKSKELEHNIDNYLDQVIQGGLLFKEGIRYYLSDELPEFEVRLQDIDELESDADDGRRIIENMLYEHTLLPESRGDILGIIENTDEVLNVTARTLMQFSVEKPEFPVSYHKRILDLTEVSVSAIEEIVAAIRAYFRDVSRVRDDIKKVMFYEKEADKIADAIKREIFNSGESKDLGWKLHMRDFVVNIEGISDTAEQVGDRLSIAAIKRSI